MEHEIGKRIAELRKGNGWTQAELAEKLGISDKAISKWESGRGCPDISQFPAIAQLFAVSIDFIMTGAESAPPQEPAEKEAPVQTNFQKEKITMKTRDFILKIVKDVCLMLLGLGLVACGLMGAFLQPSGADGYIEFVQMAFIMSGAALTIIASIRIAESALKRRDAKKGE